jgi:ribose transport system ATP-binding protein
MARRRKLKKLLLEAKGIYKQFAGTEVLHGIDFDINYGEAHALIGENGAGKSTLIKIIAGVHQADRGSVVLEEKEMKLHSPKEAFDAGISTIYQEFNLVPYLDVGANIFLGRETKIGAGIIDKKTIYRKAEELLARIGASINPKTLVKDLGVAEKQMVEISKALALNAKIVIMDEPTAVLSSKEIDKLFKIIHSLKADGISIIYISHRLEELPQIADRVSVLRDGKFIGELSKGNMTKNTITRMMIGRELTEQYPHGEKKIGDVALEVEHLSRENVIEDISFKVHSGEILGLSGLVGSGRTETVRAIMGLDRINRGNIYLNGEKTDIKSPIDAKNKGIVLVPEERKKDGLVLSLSIENNISLPYLKKMGGGFLVSKARTSQVSNEMVKAVEIKPKQISTCVQNLSGGNQQKVAIAKWVYEPHKVMIFDEPTRGVDVGAKAEIYKIMHDLAKKGHAIIMVSSDLNEIIGMSDRVIVMKEGRISGTLGKEDLTEHAVLQLAF